MFPKNAAEPQMSPEEMTLAFLLHASHQRAVPHRHGAADVRVHHGGHQPAIPQRDALQLW
jgi:hypothetical protein